MSSDDPDARGNRVLAGERKAVYVRDPDGQYRKQASEGWKVEEIVTSAAVDEFRRLAEEAKADCHAGRASPLAYHMYRCRLDPGSLAQAAGIAGWRVRRHLRPGPFARLSPRLLSLYAEILDMDPDSLRQEP